MTALEKWWAKRVIYGGYPMLFCSEYERLRGKGYTCADAFRAAKVNGSFYNLEDVLVKLEMSVDEDLYDEGDMFNPKCNPDIRPERLEKERKELWERIERDGVWIVATYFRRHEDDDWIYVDSVGGFIGMDHEDSGYDVDLKEAALDALRNEASLESKYN